MPLSWLVGTKYIPNAQMLFRFRREIEADLSADSANQDRYKVETAALAECPLCNRMVLRCSQGSYGATGQMCADCGVVVCTDCGSVVPRYMVR